MGGEQADHRAIRGALGVLITSALLTGCGGAASSAAAPRPTFEPSASPAIASAARTPPPSAPSAAVTSPPVTLPISRVDFACRLPVAHFSAAGRLDVGFISFPQATFAADPAGPPKGPHFDTFYDRAVGHWLPVAGKAVAPDGRTYAWIDWRDPGSTIHLVDAATGSDRSSELPGFPLVPVVLDFDGTTVWLDSGYEGPTTGLWAADAATLKYRRVVDQRFLQQLRAGVAWLGGVDPRDPDPPQEIEGLSSNSVVRLEIANGKRTTWLYLPGKQVFVLGIDGGGNPIVEVGGDIRTNNQVIEIRVLQSPTINTVIYQGVAPVFYQLADSHGLWFTGPGGIYLFSSVHGFQRISDDSGNLAGTCS